METPASCFQSASGVLKVQVTRPTEGEMSSRLRHERCVCLRLHLYVIEYSTVHVCACVSLSKVDSSACVCEYLCVLVKRMCVNMHVYVYEYVCVPVCVIQSGSNNVHLLKCSCDVLVVSTPVHSRKKYYTFYFTTCI